MWPSCHVAQHRLAESLAPNAMKWGCGVGQALAQTAAGRAVRMPARDSLNGVGVAPFRVVTMRCRLPRLSGQGRSGRLGDVVNQIPTLGEDVYGLFCAWVTADVIVRELHNAPQTHTDTRRPSLYRG